MACSACQKNKERINELNKQQRAGRPVPVPSPIPLGNSEPEPESTQLPSNSFQKIKVLPPAKG